jgi:hypothetical protein
LYKDKKKTQKQKKTTTSQRPKLETKFHLCIKLIRYNQNKQNDVFGIPFFQMFSFPTDLFAMHTGGGGSGGRPTNSNALVPHQHGLFGNSLMMPMPFMSSPFGGSNNLFDSFGINTSPFAMMERMMRSANDGLYHNANTNSDSPMHSFTSTTVMSYSGADGRPKVYQESTSRSRGPGGLEETRQAIRDSERGINKVIMFVDDKHRSNQSIGTQNCIYD